MILNIVSSQDSPARKSVKSEVARERKRTSTKKVILSDVGKSTQGFTKERNTGKNNLSRSRQTRRASGRSETKAQACDKTENYDPPVKPVKVSEDPIPTSIEAKPVASQLTDKETKPKLNFSDLGLSDILVSHVVRPIDKGGLGLSQPTDVQAKAIPAILSGKDVLVKSETGSGKTLCFVLPVINTISMLNPRVGRNDGIYCIILSPTRELSFQITEVVDKVLKRFFWIISGAIVGGEKRKSEKNRLRKGLNILVATPGRFIDHLEKTESLRLSIGKGSLKYIILDEADRLTDSGFEKQTSKAFEIINELIATPSNNHSYQTILISATLSDGVKNIANTNMKDPVRIEIKQTLKASSVTEKEQNLPSDGPLRKKGFSMPKQLVQQYLMVDRKLRLVGLCAFVLRQVTRSSHTMKMIIFVSCRAQVEFLHKVLHEIVWPPKQMLQKLNVAGDNEGAKSFKGLGASWWKLHGSIEQKERRRTVAEFAKAKGGVLICTDVAARGLDLPNIDWIVQYDPPSDVEDYVHRVGRTARGGRKGSAIIFLSPEEEKYVEILKGYDVRIKPVVLASVLKSLIPTKQRVHVRTKLKGIASRALFDAAAAGDLLQIKLEDLVNGTHNTQAFGRSKHRKKTLSEQEELDLDSHQLKTLAEDAYVSFLRAYAVHSKETKHIFHPKRLHLGHVARAFGLREQPTGITKVNSERQQERKRIAKARQGQRDFVKKAKLSQGALEFK